MCAVLKIILANLPFAELRLRDARCQALTADVGRVPHMQTLPGHPHGDAQEPPRSRGPTGGGGQLGGVCGRLTGPNTVRRRCLSPRAWNRCSSGQCEAPPAGGDGEHQLVNAATWWTLSYA